MNNAPAVNVTFSIKFTSASSLKNVTFFIKFIYLAIIFSSKFALTNKNVIL